MTYYRERTVAAIDACTTTVDADDGKHTFHIDEETLCRLIRGRLTGMPLGLEEIPLMVKVGAPVYVASDHGLKR